MAKRMTKKGKIFIGITVSIIFIVWGINLSQHEISSAEHYSFMIHKSNFDNIDFLLDFKLNFDFDKQKGNLSFRAIDEDLGEVVIVMPGECIFNFPSYYDDFSFVGDFNIYTLNVTPEKIDDLREEAKYNINISCSKLSSNSRFAFYLSASEIEGKREGYEQIGSILMEFNLGNWIRCRDNCINLDVASSNLIWAQIGNVLEIYSPKISRFSDENTIQFNINTYNHRTLVFANLLQGFGIGLLAAVIVFWLQRTQ